MIWVLIPRGMSRMVSWTVLVGLWVCSWWSMRGFLSLWVAVVGVGGRVWLERPVSYTGPVVYSVRTGLHRPVGDSRIMLWGSVSSLSRSEVLASSRVVSLFISCSLLLLNFTPDMGWDFSGRVRLGLASLLKARAYGRGL